MITEHDRLINKLMGWIYPDPRDKSLLRINFDSILQCLLDAGFILPVKEFETKLEQKLNKDMPKDMPSNSTGKFIVASAIINLAKIMNIPRSKIEEYYDNQDKAFSEKLQEVEQLEEEARKSNSLNFNKNVDVHTLRSFVKGN